MYQTATSPRQENHMRPDRSQFGTGRRRVTGTWSQYKNSLPVDGLGEVDGLFSSIKKVVKKAAPVLLPVAGIVAAPFTGGASLAVATIATSAMAKKAGGTASAKDMVAAQLLPGQQSTLMNGQPTYAGAGGEVYSPALPGQGLRPGMQYGIDPQTGQPTMVPVSQGIFGAYTTPIMIGGGVLVFALGVYLITKPSQSAAVAA